MINVMTKDGMLTLSVEGDLATVVADVGVIIHGIYDEYYKESYILAEFFQIGMKGMLNNASVFESSSKREENEKCM
jgi:type IV secretory pathway VirB2 component (pilin)